MASGMLLYLNPNKRVIFDPSKKTSALEFVNASLVIRAALPIIHDHKAAALHAIARRKPEAKYGGAGFPKAAAICLKISR